MTFSPPVETVDFHLWQPCNMRCRFCFGSFQDVRQNVLPAGHLERRQAVRAVELLAVAGFQKITFAGGEPLLCPWIVELVEVANRSGAQTCVVTNGSLLSADLINQLRGVLDWVTLSIDSLSEQTLRQIGRATRGRPLSANQYIQLARQVWASGIALRVNTVVSSANVHEDMSAFISLIRPVRWKVLQVLPVKGQNTGKVEPYLISGTEFRRYVDRHRWLDEETTTIVVETNDDLIGSYAMVDPAGRFFDNTQGHYTYSESILDVGVERAIAQVTISAARFRARGGDYYLPIR